MAIRPIILLALIALLSGIGCTVVHTVPLAARGGDTIVVSVGSPTDMTKANTDVFYTPAGQAQIAIPDTAIQAIFNLYPGKDTNAWLYSNADIIENSTGHGPWTTVLVIDLPDSIPNGGPLPVGNGSIQVSTDPANYPNNIPDVNGQYIALEILSGAGSPNTFDYLSLGNPPLVFDSPLTDLEALPRLRFAPAFIGIDTTNTYGAVEIKLGIFSGGIDENTDYHVVLDDKIGTTQSRRVHMTWSKTKFVTTVYFISPTGKLQYSDVDFSIISGALQNAFLTGSQNVATDVTINSVTWYDVDGNVVTNNPPVINLYNLTGT